MRRFVAGVLTAFVIVAALGAAALWWGSRAFDSAGPLAAETALVLPRGIGLDEIARRLAEAGVIETPWLFVWGVRLSGAARGLQAGEFGFAPGVSARGVMALLLSGRTVVRRLTVPEGLTTRQVVGLLAATGGLTGA
ncbi:MAG: endolytic transglycosylase MltG, partial [Proteobacteria bacterium]|nr:endolytic transglycosylase MltG [Pseudomonadota bacterium]